MSVGGESGDAQKLPAEGTQKPPGTQPPSSAAASDAAKSQDNAGSTSSATDTDIDTEVDNILQSDPPTWQWILAAFGILVVGTAVSYVIWRAIKPTDFMPSSNYAVYAGLFVMAAAIERVLEPFSGLFVTDMKKKKMKATVTAVKANVASAAATASPEKPEARQNAVAARTNAATAQHDFHQAQSIRAVLMWATASALAMLACAALGIFLLRSVETPSATGATSASASAAATKSVPSGPTPAKDPNRVLDLLVTGLVVGAGTKPLHDLISQIQTSLGSSKASSSAPTITTS